MFKKKPTIKYESIIPEYPNSITPARQHIPEWYKKIPKWKNNEVWSKEGGVHRTLKHCTPFLDTFTTGYMITLPYDIYVKQVDGTPTIVWKDEVSFPPWYRDNVADNNLIPFGHFPLEFTWTGCVAFGLPKGYSALFTHPLNRHDLPFTTLSGIIDGGYISHGKGSVPFFIKDGFQGFIEQGTPIMQIIPFRQESWNSKVEEGLSKIGEHNRIASGLKFWGWYKQNFWTKKDYF